MALVLVTSLKSECLEGITPTVSEDGQYPSHGGYVKALLYEGRGMEAVQHLVAGLRSFFPIFGQETPKNWSSRYLSNVTALQVNEQGPSFVIKAYDYRHGKKPANDRRTPKINLVRKFIDQNARLITISDNLCIVKTEFLRREETATTWFDAVPASRIADILRALEALHKMDYVHGDIRLYNTLPHVGKLVDFDFTRKEGCFYPSTLELLPWDGQRAQEVQDAIMNKKSANVK